MTKKEVDVGEDLVASFASMAKKNFNGFKILIFV